MRLGICAVILALASVTATSAAPRAVELSIQDGRVWLVARDATVSQILAEWARVGQTTITNGDRVPGGRVTLELPGVPEKQALDLVLRSASGFVATTRANADNTGPRSQFEHIMIVAASNAPANGPTPSYPTATAPHASQPSPAPYAVVNGSQPAPYGSPAPYANTTVSQPSPVPYGNAAAPASAVSDASGGAWQPPAPAPQPYPIAPGVQRIVGADGQPVPDDQEDPSSPAPQPARRPGSMPPGFASPPQTAPPPAPAPGTPAVNAPRTTSPATNAPRTAPGAPVPGMIVAPPAPPVQPAQPVRPPR